MGTRKFLYSQEIGDGFRKSFNEAPHAMSTRMTQLVTHIPNLAGGKQIEKNQFNPRRNAVNKEGADTAEWHRSAYLAHQLRGYY